ncbi:hypothetical protein F5887DRAFT_918088 [Amanita rubescens]|nr:hypothetical protein F5887DRAFT_918088 [Amanita rubescens]
MQLNLKLVSACLFLFVGAIVSSANALPAKRELVIYGSGYVAKRNFGGCPLDPGAVCGGLASTCAATLATGADVTLVWQIVSCTCAAIWCGTQAILNLLCCLGKLPNCDGGNNFIGDKSIDVSQQVIDNIATFADNFGNTFSNGKLWTPLCQTDLLHASQGNGGGSIANNPALVNIINEIMQQITGDPNGMASLDQVNSYLEATDFAAGWQN